MRKAKYTPIGWLVSLWRQIVGVPIILFTLGFSELLVLFTKYKQTLHDILSGAVVVRIDITRAPQVAGRKAPSNLGLAAELQALDAQAEDWTRAASKPSAKSL